MGFLLIAISKPANSDSEAETIRRLFHSGLELFHLRKPESSAAEMELLIRAIPDEYRHRIVIHSHFELAIRYSLAGIHLNENWIREKLPLRFKSKSLSYSLHSLSRLRELQPRTSHVFMSPVFDSISKPGYKAAIDLEEASILLKRKKRDFPGKVIALGGISEKNILQVKEAGFDGAAVLGALWGGTDAVENFKKIRSKIL